jgi:hypothetical protein
MTKAKFLGGSKHCCWGVYARKRPGSTKGCSANFISKLSRMQRMKKNFGISLALGYPRLINADVIIVHNISLTYHD